MPKFRVHVYANIPCLAKVIVEADSEEQALEIAEKNAWNETYDYELAKSQEMIEDYEVGDIEEVTEDE